MTPDLSIYPKPLVGILIDVLLSYLFFTPTPQVWAHYEEQPVEEVMPVLEEKERSASYKPVFVTEITDDLHFYVQDVETGECL